MMTPRFLVVGTLLGCAQPAPTPPPPPTTPASSTLAGAQESVKFTYPAARKVDVVDDYHGTKVADPYRWLEALDSEETRSWVEAQNKVTFGYLGKIPERDRIRKRLTELWNFERYSPPVREGGNYFFSKNDGLQNQSVLYVTPALTADPRVLLDPNKLTADGTAALTGTAVTDDGKLLAYGVATAGSDWEEWRVREVDSGKDRPDVIKWIKFSRASWTKDGKGFFYSRFAEPKAGQALAEQNFYQKLYFHKLGTPQEQDALIYERKDQKEWQFGAEVTEDGRYLVISVAKGTDDKNRVLYLELGKKGAKPVELVDNFDHEFSFIGNDGPLFYFITDKDAPRRRVTAVDLRKPKAWQDVLPQAKETVRSANLINDLLVVSYLQDAHAQVRIFGIYGDRKGQALREVALPGIGSAVGFQGKRKDKETFYAFTSYNTPAQIYRLDLTSFESTLFRRPKLAFNPEDYETRQVFYASKDGTKVPMFLTHKKGLKPSGDAPTYLYGYGGFNQPLTPGFSSAELLFMELGGVYAVANLRGGGEYGEEWHKAGTKQNKQRVFDDFISAAEWLVQNQITNPKKLAISGRSNGGLLVGACMTQRPDLFGAALPGVGVMDMLRFHKFTIGWAWSDDYGNSDDPAMFKALYAYSPLHNIKSGTRYPATFITTGDHDDRVVPAHSFKFAAALQAAQAGEKPVFIRIETRAGHGAGKPTSKRIDESADALTFLWDALQMKAQ